MLSTNKRLNLLKLQFNKLFHKKAPSAVEIRKRFIDFFVENDHKIIRSSPIVPHCDPTVVFVNAGMNQFKNVFLGKTSPVCERATNSQKCVRVGGKHNDLNVVGSDGYHHTFFEMLGNWSFGNYFKKEACEYAWNMLKGPYNIDTRRLFVTYFGGDKSLGLNPDIECREIWRSLGIPKERILPFGLKDNFWEMSATGPCGPCTEIHIDHLYNSDVKDRVKFVNAGHSSLTELWNIVFIEYNRNQDGSITPLPIKHIDTGMGMERLVAILQEKTSNYGTDLFTPIFDHIHKVTNAPIYQDVYNLPDAIHNLNTAYRILADHSRMITACIADGMFPDQNHKLRRVLRKAISISERSFKHKNILPEIVPVVVDILGETYPEMHRKKSEILQVILHEYDLFKTLIHNTSADLEEILIKHPSIEQYDVTSYPGFVPAYKELKSICANKTVLPGELMFKLYDTYGLNEEIIKKIAETENLSLDKKEFEICLAKTRHRTKTLYMNDSNLNVDNVTELPSHLLPTQNDYKYIYKFDTNRNEYEIPRLQSNVMHIEPKPDGFYDVIVDQSNFYYTSGGQESDTGRIVNQNDIEFNVHTVNFTNGYVIHNGKFVKGGFEVGDNVELIVDNERRTKNIQNHTGTHILNAAVKLITNSVTFQKSSSVTNRCLKLELAVLGCKIDKNYIEKIEQLVRQIIKTSTTTKESLIDIYTLNESNDITLVPGEIYPDNGLRIIYIENKEYKYLSKEPCCGTHASSTSELIDFCITNVKSNGRGSYIFTAITGEDAKQVHLNGEALTKDIIKLKTDLDTKTANKTEIDANIRKYRTVILQQTLPHVTKLKSLDILNDMMKDIKDASKNSLREFVEIEMKNVLEQCPANTHPFIVHFLSSATLMDFVMLQKATRHCNDRPIIVLSLTDDTLKARCCVPKFNINKNFSADLWLNEVANTFNTEIIAPRGQNIKEVCNMKSTKIVSALFEELLDDAMLKANEYAKKYL